MKGLSQILYLIIAASVMMVAALTLIIQIPPGPDRGTTCQQQIDTQCDIKGAQATMSVPTQCTKQDGETPVDGLPSEYENQVSSGQISCNAILN